MEPLRNFNLRAFIEVMEELARADEIERALSIPQLLPAYYRDHPPPEIIKLANDIMAKVATIDFYKNTDFYPGIVNFDSVSKTLRYKLLVRDVEHLNKLGFTPHIVDYGPGEFWVPICLNDLGLNYTYQPIVLNDVSFNKTKKLFEDKLRTKKTGHPSIFLALEIIEHLWHEDELKINMLQTAGFCDILHVSTPKYTHNYNNLNWRSTGTLGHLRAYTPTEFFTTVQDLFSEYKDYQFFDSGILHVRGHWRGSLIDSYPLDGGN